jgi:hypothetical protein
MQINDFLGVNAVRTPGRHPLVIALAVLVFAECALLIAATIFLVVELVIATPDSYGSAVALTVLAALAALWLGVVGVNVLRGRAWTRGATLVWQVLQIAVAVGCFQGFFARPDIGWALLVPALAVLVLLFTKPVIAATSQRDA